MKKLNSERIPKTIRATEAHLAWLTWGSRFGLLHMRLAVGDCHGGWQAREGSMTGWGKTNGKHPLGSAPVLGPVPSIWRCLCLMARRGVNWDL